MDTFLEEKLDDIDEFIQSELGFEPLSAAGVNTLGSFSQTREFLDGLAGNPGKKKIEIIFKTVSVEIAGTTLQASGFK